ncbi:diguanylate cyclase [Colwellia sp. MB02u-6]|uniref:diguanylate cyclase n=1 Tax=Colwellia sp. MB02u-6 TaxID=2759824 RepID=UPI0015F60205|nr:diguanylate cyclase [Colwellia sp. MB02u-6]MBA6326646.1 diguanylate cyclase [Colwellia sp. MB02u-6]
MKALVIASSKSVRTIIRVTLESHGFFTDSVSDEKDAIALIQQNNYQLICVNKTLGSSDCRLFCSKLRASPATQSTPIIMLSALVEQDPESFMVSGITEIFSKNDISSFSDYVQSLSKTIDNSNFISDGRILYVEDSMSIANSTVPVLNKRGYEVSHITTGEEAIKLYDDEEQDFDLVMTDIILAGKISGTAVVRHIRGKEKKHKSPIPIPILAMSSFDDSSRKLALFQAGVNDYVPKPIMAEELLARIDNLILNRKLFKQLEVQRERLEELAMTDQLTGLYNRHYLLDSASKKISAAKRHNIDLCLVVIDIDFFKSFNDKHGHAMGDLMLTKVAELLSSHVRNNDIVARFGGEEFVILYDYCPLAKALEKTEVLRKALEQLKPEGLTLTASFGLAQFNPQDKDFDGLFVRADEGVYLAKGNGRNCVVSV